VNFEIIPSSKRVKGLTAMDDGPHARLKPRYPEGKGSSIPMLFPSPQIGQARYTKTFLGPFVAKRTVLFIKREPMARIKLRASGH